MGRRPGAKNKKPGRTARLTIRLHAAEASRVASAGGSAWARQVILQALRAHEEAQALTQEAQA